jgi:hypothetical protein
MRRVLVLVATLAVLAAVAGPAAADGRTIQGNFCLSDHLFCMSASVDGQAPVEGYGVDGNGGVCAKPGSTVGGPQYCVPSGTGLLTIRPGIYWITVDDTLNSHNFEFRSCPGSTTACGPGQGSTPKELTPVCNDDPANPDVFKCSTTSPYPETAANEIVATWKVNLQPGTYRLYCDAVKPVVHENAGMYIDIFVGGVGQVGG